MERDAKKLKLIEDTQKMWEKYQNVHNRIHSIKLSFKSLIKMEKEIKLQKMPPMQYKYFKMKGTFKMVEVQKSNITIFKDDALFIQKSIGMAETQFGIEKKTFEVPKLDDGVGLKGKCGQFELLLESFEEQIKVLNKEKEKSEQSKTLVKTVQDSNPSPQEEQNIEDGFSQEDIIEKMNILNLRLSIFYQDFFTVENGLHSLEDDTFGVRLKEIVSEDPDIIAIMVQKDMHIEYIKIKMKKVFEFIERLKNQMKKIQIKEGFESIENEDRECPKFSSDNPWQSIHYTFKYIYQEILSLKYDLEKLLDFLDDE